MIDYNKTLEQLEGIIWNEPEYDSNLVINIHRLRKKPLKDFTIEDLRIIIGQNFSLDLLIPLAIERLMQNILAEGHFYPGDLLKAVLDVETDYWLQNSQHWLAIKDLFEKNQQIFDSDNTYRQIRKSFQQFEEIIK